MELVTIVHEASLQWRQEYERVVDAILCYAYSAGVLSINMCVEGLALTADFTLRTIMDPQKWTFIDENIPLMDYKGVRSLFKCLIYQQFNSIPAQLSPEQRRQLLPAERILLKILDPDLNVIPPIFTLTELSRGILKRAYMFPGLLRQVTHGRTQWDEILSVLISETMAEVIKAFLFYYELCFLISARYTLVHLSQ
uniref:Mediator of RNA polymerase II transcription subunit 23 n=1 Tax=Angiostrongylus cantonensis TaxID=6313 RepID=A0A0K0DP00_ANGCA